MPRRSRAFELQDEWKCLCWRLPGVENQNLGKVRKASTLKDCLAEESKVIRVFMGLSDTS